MLFVSIHPCLSSGKYPRPPYFFCFPQKQWPWHVLEYLQRISIGKYPWQSKSVLFDKVAKLTVSLLDRECVRGKSRRIAVKRFFCREKIRIRAIQEVFLFLKKYTFWEYCSFILTYPVFPESSIKCRSTYPSRGKGCRHSASSSPPEHFMFFLCIREKAAGNGCSQLATADNNARKILNAFDRWQDKEFSDKSVRESPFTAHMTPL